MSEAKMPNCPRCRNDKNVEVSLFPKNGTHYCRCPKGWFTPEAMEGLRIPGISQEIAKELLESLKWALENLGEPYEWTTQEDADAHRKALEAIDKAEGR